MSSMRQRWENFWFEPASPDNLALCRIVFFGILFLFYLRYEDFSAWVTVSDAFWRPTWFFREFHLPLLPSLAVVALQDIWKLALLLSCVGLFTRASTVVSFVLGAYLLCLPHNFGKVHHYDAVLVFALLFMALSRCGDRRSLDHVIHDARRHNDSSGDAPLLSGEYTWPVRAIWVMMSLIFFAAGVSKVRHSGFGWIFDDSMAIWLVQHQYHIANTDPFLSWGPYLAHYIWIPRLLGAASLIFEIGYPIALLSRRVGWIFVVGAALMQLGIHALLGPSFEQEMICNVFWVPWDRVAAYVALRFSRRKLYEIRAREGTWP
jgi:hypothetical protein